MRKPESGLNGIGVTYFRFLCLPPLNQPIQDGLFKVFISGIVKYVD
jgi:hypothetical protein